MAVRDLVVSGHQVVFDDEACGGGYALNKKTGQKLKFIWDGRSYVFDMKVYRYEDSKTILRQLRDQQRDKPDSLAPFAGQPRRA